MLGATLAAKVREARAQQPSRQYRVPALCLCAG